MVAFCRVVTLTCCVLAAIGLGGTIFASGTAIQEAAGAAICCAVVIIPYVFTRMVEDGAAADAKVALKAPD
jgi:hypothetical protein